MQVSQEEINATNHHVIYIHFRMDATTGPKSVQRGVLCHVVTHFVRDSRFYGNRKKLNSYLLQFVENTCELCLVYLYKRRFMCL